MFRRINIPFFVHCLCAFFPVFLLSSVAQARDETLPRYEIKARIDTAVKKVYAEQRVVWTNVSSREASEVFFHVYPNRVYSVQEKKFVNQFAAYFKVDFFPEGFQSGAIYFESIEADGQKIDPVFEGEDRTILKVRLPRPVARGERVELFMRFRVDIPHAYGRFGWHESLTRLSRWYPILSVHDQRGWHNHPFYVLHRPFFSEASYYDVELTVGQDEVVVHSGDLASEQQNVGGTKTLSIGTPLPIREFSLAMSPQYLRHTEGLGGVMIHSYYLPGHEDYARLAAQDAKDLMVYYTNRFGAYPYKTFSISPVHLGYGGEQMSNMVFIDTRVYELPRALVRYFDFLIAHETGHQWFYNLVGMDEFSEMWMEEGVNSYFIAEYLEEKYGPNAEVIEYPQWFSPWKWILPELTFRRTRDIRYKTLVRYGYDHPIVGKLSSFQEPSSIFALTYGKGSRVVEMLRQRIGEEAFADVFVRLFSEYRMKNVSVVEFQRICEDESGQDLDEFFHAWLADARTLNYAVEGVTGRNKDSVVLANRGQIHEPVDVKVISASGQEKIFRWEGHKRKEEVPVDGPVKSVAIDPDNKWLDIDRVDNFWPRKVNAKAVPLYLPLYDVPLFLPEDGYNVVIGPEIISNGLGVKTSFQRPYDYNIYAATGYEFGEDLHVSRGGFQLNNILNTQTVFGAEVANRTDLDDGSEDLVTQKIYLRRELWPAKYNLSDINDHVSLYIVRNRGTDGLLAQGEREDSRNTSYLKRDEAIAGTLLHIGRSGPSPDPSQGFNIDAMIENSGHFWGATQQFTRASLDTSVYIPVTQRSKFAYRVKGMGGFPDDKNLFELGGMSGLRGYDRKSLRGTNAFLASVEYRFPLASGLRFKFLDNFLGLESVSGVVFFDAGQNWYSSFDDSKLRKDAGGGLRFTMNIGSFLEKVVLRLDAAQAINEPKEDTKVWFGINHAF